LCVLAQKHHKEPVRQGVGHKLPSVGEAE